MSTARERLAELERDFGAPHATMNVDDYLAKRDVLAREVAVEASQPAPEAAPTPAPAAPVAKDRRPVTWKTFLACVETLVVEIRAMMARSLSTRDAKITALQAQLDAAVVKAESAEHRLSRHAEHLRRLEDRVKKLEHGK